MFFFLETDGVAVARRRLDIGLETARVERPVGFSVVFLSSSETLRLNQDDKKESSKDRFCRLRTLDITCSITSSKFSTREPN